LTRIIYLKLKFEKEYDAGLDPSISNVFASSAFRSVLQGGG